MGWRGSYRCEPSASTVAARLPVMGRRVLLTAFAVASLLALPPASARGAMSHNVQRLISSARPRDGGKGWAATAVKFAGKNGQEFNYICPGKGTRHPVWGT